MKLTSYQKLKKQKDEFERLYSRAMKRLQESGKGILEDDVLIGGEEKINEK
jgi:hypothetical protein